MSKCGDRLLRAAREMRAMLRFRDPIADALLAKYKRDARLLKEVRRVCGVKE